MVIAYIYNWLFGYQIKVKITMEFWESEIRAILLQGVVQKCS